MNQKQAALSFPAIFLEGGVLSTAAMSHVGVVAIAVGLHDLRLLVAGADICALRRTARARPVSKLDHQRLSWRHLHQRFASAYKTLQYALEQDSACCNTPLTCSCYSYSVLTSSK